MTRQEEAEQAARALWQRLAYQRNDDKAASEIATLLLEWGERARKEAFEEAEGIAECFIGGKAVARALRQVSLANLLESAEQETRDRDCERLTAIFGLPVARYETLKGCDIPEEFGEFYIVINDQNRGTPYEQWMPLKMHVERVEQKTWERAAQMVDDEYRKQGESMPFYLANTLLALAAALRQQGGSPITGQEATDRA